MVDNLPKQQLKKVMLRLFQELLKQEASVDSADNNCWTILKAGSVNGHVDLFSIICLFITANVCYNDLYLLLM